MVRRTGLGFALMAALMLLHGCSAPGTPEAAVQTRPVMPTEPARPLPEQQDEREPGSPLTPQELGAEIGTVLEQRYPGWRAVQQPGEYVELWRGDDIGPGLPIGPAYAEYLADPVQKHGVIAGAVERLRQIEELAPTWEKAQTSLFPQMVSLDRFLAMDEVGAMPVYAQLSDEIVLVVELRLAGATHLVHHGLQARWKQPAAVLIQQALDNLEAETPPMIQDGDGIWRFPVEDGYQAARVLLTSRLAEVDARVPGPLIIALPAANSVWAFESADMALVARMKRQTEAAFAAADQPLMLSWLRFDGNQLQMFEEDQDGNGA